MTNPITIPQDERDALQCAIRARLEHLMEHAPESAEIALLLRFQKRLAEAEKAN